MTNEELDRMVAEKVMGYKWRRWHDMKYRSPDGPLRRTLCKPGEWICVDENYEDCDLSDPKQMALQAHYHGPAYSTDISAAWQVVEKMRADNFGFTMYYHVPNNAAPSLVSFNPGGRAWGRGDGKGAFGATGCDARSICRAALAAKGIEVPA